MGEFDDIALYPECILTEPVDETESVYKHELKSEPDYAFNCGVVKSLNCVDNLDKDHVVITRFKSENKSFEGCKDEPMEGNEFVEENRQDKNPIDQESHISMLLNTLKHTYRDDLKLGEYMFDQLSLETLQNNSRREDIKAVAMENVHDRRNSCFFCSKSYAKITRHYLTQHNSEPIIKNVIDLKVERERCDKLELLRSAGNFKNNIKTLLTKKGELYVARRPSLGKTTQVSGYVPCLFCLGFFYRRQASVHMNKCKFNSGAPISQYVARGYDIIHSVLGQANTVHSEIVAKMKNDAIKRMVESDNLILEYGEMLSGLKEKSPTQNNVTSHKMRLLARLIIEVNKISQKTENLSYYLKSCHHEMLFQAATNLAFDSNYENAPVTLSKRLNHTLIEMCDMIKEIALSTGNEIMKKDARNFKYLMTTKWGYGLSLSAVKEKKSEKVPLLNVTEDILMLAKRLKSQVNSLTIKLTESPSLILWNELAKISLGSVILFNKRRDVETARILLNNYMNTNRKESSRNEILESLSITESTLTEIFDVMQIDGKGGINITVILIPVIQSAIQTLCYKRLEVGISHENPYLFADLSCNDAINYCTSLYSVKYPHIIHCNELRNYISTVFQITCLSKNEFEILTNRMGYNLANSMKYCSVHQSAVGTAKAAKRLLAIDEGLLQRAIEQFMTDVSFEQIIPEFGKAISEYQHSNVDLVSCQENRNVKIENIRCEESSALESEVMESTELENDDEVMESTDNSILHETNSYENDAEVREKVNNISADSSLPTLMSICHSAASENIANQSNDNIKFSEFTFQSKMKDENISDINDSAELLSPNFQSDMKNEVNSGNMQLLLSTLMLKRVQPIYPNCDIGFQENSENQISHENISEVNYSLGQSPLHSILSPDFQPSTSEETKASCRRAKMQTHRRWDEDLKQRVLETFARYIKLKQAPGKTECLKFISEHNVKNRTWTDVKALVYNSYSKKK